MSKIREKESLECVKMHIWASKTQKLPGPLSGPWTPGRRMLASLRRQLSASEAGAPPLDQILEPHLNKWGYESVKHIVDFYFNTDGNSTE